MSFSYEISFLKMFLSNERRKKPKSEPVGLNVLKAQGLLRQMKFPQGENRMPMKFMTATSQYFFCLSLQANLSTESNAIIFFC